MHLDHVEHFSGLSEYECTMTFSNKIVLRRKIPKVSNLPRLYRTLIHYGDLMGRENEKYENKRVEITSRAMRKSILHERAPMFSSFSTMPASERVMASAAWISSVSK